MVLAAPRPARLVVVLAAPRPVRIAVVHEVAAPHLPAPAEVAAPVVDHNAARLTFDRLLFFKTFHRSQLFSKGFRKGAFCWLLSRTQ